MQRLIARFLLLFALAGNFVPLVLAATVAPAHACCLRKSAHQCHGSAGEAEQLSIRSIECCNEDCYRAVVVSQWAHPQAAQVAVFESNVEECLRDSAAPAQAKRFFASQSTRAPPSSQA